MHRGVATGRPASAKANEPGVVGIADKKVAARDTIRSWGLGVASETKIHVPLHKHLRIDGAVRVVANRAALAQGRVLEDVRPGFFTMALGAALVEARHGKPARRLHNVHAVRIVALDAIHLAFQDGVVLGQMKFRARFLMALETGFGVFAGIDDEFLEATATGHGDVLAAGAVAGFTAVLAGHVRLFQTQASVRTGWEHSSDVLMAISTGLVPDVSCTFDLQRDDDSSIRRAGIQE